MVEDEHGTTPECGGDGFRLYAEMYALRLGFDALDPLDPLEPLATTEARESDGVEPPAPARRGRSRPWR